MAGQPTMESPSGNYVPPEEGVRTILSDVALNHEPASPTVRPQLHSLSKFHASRKGRIRVNKEVLAILKQVSAELDAAQRHYLAHKQYGDAGASILSISPDLISLPGDPSAVLACSASEAAFAGAGCDASGDAAAGGEHHAGEPDTLLAHGQRRWGYFPMLSHLRTESAKATKKPHPQQPKTVVIAKAPPDIAAAAAVSDDDSDESPKANWMQLMKQKKQVKESTFARMIRVRHAVLVVQRAWRAHVKKRASKALAMMMLRAKVRRAHRAAYVSNLLRRKTGQTGGAAAAPNGEAEEEQLPDEDVQLTAEEEAEMAKALQIALNEGTLSMADIEELQLTELVDKMKASQPSNISCEPEEGEEQEQAPIWKSYSTVTTPLRRGLTIKLDGDSPSSGSNWMGSLRTPGSSNTPGGTHIRISQNWDLDEGSSKNSTPRSRNSGGGRQRLSSSKSVSIRGSGSDVGSPRTPRWGPIVGPDGVLASPRNRSATRGKSGGIRVGKGVSVVLATADNAAAMQGLVLGPDGTWQQVQQQSRADAWFERLKAQRKAGRQPWDPTSVPSGSSLSGELSQHGSSESLGLNPGDQGSDRLPSGKCGTRALVHNAWLYIDGRSTAALPWQALAAATAAKGGPLPPGNDRAASLATALAAAEAFMTPRGALAGSHMRQLSVQGKRLLVKLMWLKSAAGVLRELGRDPQALESRMWQLLKKKTSPAGAELLLWSIADQKQQQDLAQQQQLLWQALQAANGAGPATLCLDNNLGVVGGRNRQQQILNSTGTIHSAANGTIHSAAVSSPGLSGASVNADLLGQYLPLLPAARSKALASRPQQQDPYQQQQQMMLAHLQLLQWQNQQQVQGASWPHALQSHQQVAVLQQLKLQGQQQQHSGSSAAGTGQIPMAHTMQLSQRIGHRHGSPPPEAAAGRPVGQHDEGRSSQRSGGESDEAQRSAAHGNAPYNAQQVGRGWGDEGNSALALYGSRSVLLQARDATHSQQKAAGFTSNQWQPMHQQQVQQQKQQQEAICADAVLARPRATVQKLLAVAELGWQPQIQQQPRNPVKELTHHWSTQQTGKLHPHRTSSELPSVSLDVSITGAGEQAIAMTGPNGTQQRPGVSYSSALTSVVGAAGSATEAEQPVYVSFVTSNRYQQQLKSQRRKTDGSLMPSRSPESIVQHQQPQQQPEGLGIQSTVVHQLGGGWAPRGFQGAPAISFPPTSTAGGSKHAGVHSAESYSPRERSSHGQSSGLEPMQGVHQKQQQPVQKRVLKTSLIGGLPVMATGSLDGFRLQPGSLQAFMGQQQQQQQEKYGKPPSIDMLVSQQRQQPQHEYLGSEREWARPSLRSAVGSLAGATGIMFAGEQQQRPRHRQSPEPDAPQLALGVRPAAASQRALRKTTDGVQWQGQRQALGASQNGGSNVTLSVAHPELPQLAALRVSTEGRTAAQ